ncbi:Hint domain-containing protein [Brucella pituitosa]|uniref:Hint domain-containing protein n=1 Tax=Brucella pituitosa TaxID=571256 RepID=UPI00200498B5|nr:Hint domain-containing protein [Brucella pituitosa]MCK4207073.1 Hint domain-containing protein [Brucella pituitosa]
MAIIGVNLFNSDATFNSSNLPANDTLQVTGIGSHTLTLDGVDTSISYGGTLAGANVAANVTIAATNGSDVVINNPTIGVNALTSFTYSVDDSSSLVLNSATVDVSLGIQNVEFTGNGGGSFNYIDNTLLPTNVTFNVTGFTTGNTLGAGSMNFSNFSYDAASGEGTFTFGGGLLQDGVTYNVQGLSESDASAIQDAIDNGTLLNADGDIVMPVCFLAGTLIATPNGERAVEDLVIGDLVLTAEGDTRPVLWIGQQTLVSVFADPIRAFPIHISSGALGDNLPVRDLFVSPDHALFLDGLLVHASALVNGTTIKRMEQPEKRFTYFHIELEDHALVLAEGVPAETFVDNVTRRRFDNYAEYEALYGEATTVIEMDLPRVKSARQLPERIRQRLNTQVAQLGAMERIAS